MRTTQAEMFSFQASLSTLTANLSSLGVVLMRKHLAAIATDVDIADIDDAIRNNGSALIITITTVWDIQY